MTNPVVQSFSVVTRNTNVPFFPQWNYPLFEADKGNISLPAFSWIQAFFDSAELTVLPQLVIYSGTDESGANTPIYSVVQFAYSGERVNVKGQGIVASATDIRGNSIASTPIGSTHTSDLLQVFAWGGMY